MSPSPRSARWGVLLLLVLPLVLMGARTPKPDLREYDVVTIPAGPDAKFALKGAFLSARPGTLIELPAGVIDVDEELSLDVSHVIVRGRGMDKTVLRFSDQRSGGQGIFVRGDNVRLEGFAIEDTPGDGIRATSDGITFKRVRVEWTTGADPENGGYGLYPVLSQNVLIDGCIVRGASDAGIYVGQSKNVIVRNNLVELNVAGIEIENTQDADVYANTATRNTAGILVFDLPNLSQAGMRVRVYRNKMIANNTPNFAAPNNVLALVPGGTGFLIMANNEVEIFQNTIRDHDSIGAAAVSYNITFNPVNDPNYDEYPEAVYFHGNHYSDIGGDAQGLFGLILASVFDPMVDIVWDGDVNPDLADANGELPDDLKICIQEGKKATFGNFLRFESTPLTDLAAHDCTHPSLPAVVLPEVPSVPPVPEDEFTDEEIAALCSAPGEGPNWNAFVVDCPQLSNYRLFPGNDATADPSPHGLPYDITTLLFSDYAQKYRFVFLPPGSSALYDQDFVQDFPVGTIIAKTFAFSADLRDPGLGEDVVETRLLIRRESGWDGLPYIWDDAEVEAFLSPGGGEADVSWVDVAGQARSTLYQIPNVNQCGRCHFGNGDEPIGPKARLLNLDYPYTTGTANQIDQWTALALLEGAPPSADAPRLAVWDDPTTGTLEERAKAYLESNCAHCHTPGGNASNTGLFLEADRPVDLRYGICKPPVAAGSGSGGLRFDIVPGKPDESILVFRMNSAEPGIAMPELSKSVVHTEGVALVREWISTLEGSCE